MNKKTLRNTIVLSLVAVVLVVTTVFTTIAYLAGNATVKNTFSVGNVAITMFESNVNSDGKKIDGEKTSTGNHYNLQPGLEYDKDPTIYVAGGSVDSYLFVVVQNDIVGIEDTTNTIDSQMIANGWRPYSTATSLSNGKKVYVYAGEGFGTDDANYAKVVKSSSDKQSFDVFETFTVAPTANITVSNSTKVELVAYAIQSAGLGTENAKATVDNAWAQLVSTFSIN